MLEAEEYGWGIAEGRVPELMGPIMGERALKGVQLKFLIPENLLTTSMSPPAIAQNIEVRGLFNLPAIVVLNEKEAGICFRHVEGRMDYAGFFGKHTTFLNWVRDLFLYYWDKGKRV